MNTLEGKAWLALAAIKGVGSRTLWQIAAYLFCRQKTASWLLKNPASARDVLKGGTAEVVLPDPDVLEPGAGEAVEETGVTVLHPLHPRFPQRIKGLQDKLLLPAILYASGNLSLLEKPGISIVGSRNAGRDALAVAEKLASQVAGAGINVTSGYAAGIDGAAHRAALRNGGTTILVLAEGLDHFKIKPEFKGLLTDENTLVISQFHPGDKWAAYQAMARNKLVAVLSSVVVVVISAAERGADGRLSGSFDAGISGLKLGLPVFTVSPSFFSLPPEGNQQLIARGGIAWDPGSGAAPVVEAMKASPGKRTAGQKRLF